MRLRELRSDQIYEHCLAQTGSSNMNISVYLDKKKGRPSSFTVKKSENIFHFRIPSAKEKKLQASDIMGTVKKLPIFKPKVQNKKDGVARRAFTLEYTYFVVFSAGVSICSLVTYEELFFVAFPSPDVFINGKLDQRTNTLTVFGKNNYFNLLIENELDEIESQFFEINDFKGAFKAAKKHQLEFKALVCFSSLEILQCPTDQVK